MPLEYLVHVGHSNDAYIVEILPPVERQVGGPYIGSPRFESAFVDLARQLGLIPSDAKLRLETQGLADTEKELIEKTVGAYQAKIDSELSRTQQHSR